MKTFRKRESPVVHREWERETEIGKCWDSMRENYM
jgi:hypothetical protein